MRLRNILIVVEDIEKSKKFYHDLFGLDVILGRTFWKEISFQRAIPVSYILRRRISKPLSKNWTNFIQI